MAENTPTAEQQAQLQAAAQTKLAHDVYAPQFFARLEQTYGLRPQNNVEAGQLLKLAGILRQNNYQPPTSQEQPNEFLDNLIKSASSQAAPVQASDQQIDQACLAAVEADPDLLAAASLLS